VICKTSVVNENEANSSYVNERLLCDDATGDAVARVAGRVGFEVVGLGVNHERGASGGEDRVIAVAQIDPGVIHAECPPAVVNFGPSHFPF
jgi:hypothetical protein